MNRIKVPLALCFLVYIFIITGCKTIPDFALRNYPGVVSQDGRLLLYFNLSKDKILIDHLLSHYSGNDFSPIITRTERLSFSIDGFNSDSKFSILAEGNFPPGITNLAMSRDAKWIKHKDKYIWWENKTEGFFSSVPFRSVAIFSNSDINTSLSLLESGDRKFIPDEVRAEFDYSAVTLYSHLPGKNIYKSLKIPSDKMYIQELFFIIDKNENNYVISGMLEFLNDHDAKIFSTALKLGLLIELRETGKDSLLKIVKDSNIKAVNSNIIIDNIVLNTDEMINLVSGNDERPQVN